jgi:hypothetical protein
MDAPLPPRRPAQSEINQLAATQAQQAPAPAYNAEGPLDGLEGLGGGIMEFLQGLFGNAFGGEAARPGYKWDSLEGWVPDGANAPVPVTPAATDKGPKSPV